MAKLNIKTGQELALGKELAKLAAEKLADGSDVTARLEPYIETLGGKIQVFVDDKPGLTKIMVPATSDLNATLDQLKGHEKDAYLQKMGVGILNRCK